jgi:hypothetical protein
MKLATSLDYPTIMRERDLGRWNPSTSAIATGVKEYVPGTIQDPIFHSHTIRSAESDFLELFFGEGVCMKVAKAGNRCQSTSKCLP